jgi:probable rRNA maturation factor
MFAARKKKCWTYYTVLVLLKNASSSFTAFGSQAKMYRNVAIGMLTRGRSGRILRDSTYKHSASFPLPTVRQSAQFSENSKMIRMFGSKCLPENPPGDIYVENNQESLKIDLERLKATIAKIRDLMGYRTYDVSLLLVDDQEMRETNEETRGMNEPTDVLSFPFTEAIEPGVLTPPVVDIGDYYNMGDMMIDVPYVIRACQDDAKYSHSDLEDEDRGVSAAMAMVMDPEERINMLLVHGMLHLVGYDHIDDDDYQLMVAKEEEILRLLGKKAE